MIRSSILARSLFALALLAGCANADDDQKKVDAAQAEANKKIAEVSKDADEKIRKAQADADKKISEAQTDFSKRREEVRHTMSVNVTEIDQKIDALEIKAKAANAKAKADLDASLVPIRASRASFNNSLKSLETASASNWDATKARVEKEWSELKAAVSKAS